MTIQLERKKEKKSLEKYLQPTCLCRYTRLVFEICDEICLILPHHIRIYYCIIHTTYMLL